MFPTGCTARIDEVLKKYEDGRMDIVVQGVRRFILESYTKTEEKVGGTTEGSIGLYRV